MGYILGVLLLSKFSAESHLAPAKRNHTLARRCAGDRRLAALA